MWAVVVTVDVPKDLTAADARAAIERELVPRAPTMPGFVRGIWMMRDGGGSGIGFHQVQDEAQARAVAERITVGGDGGAGATVRTVEVYEVLAEA